MPNNALVTGPPRSGKTTALERTVERLRDRGLRVRGLAAPEIREEGDRVGFEVVAIGGDPRAVMAHVEYDEPRVGKYGVDVAAIDRLAGTLEAAIESGGADCIVIDEIAPMQLESDRFRTATERALDASVPTVAAVADGTAGPLGEVKSRPDVETFAVEPGTRDALPERLLERVRGWR
ncbi:nucleotide kinase [Halobiforma lacisalsi AJ5]|uniref:Nucleoside-triphosphatase C445_17334 n=1 Tax=Natronobacterium lacisalsi AJ5 TaxID=358396 RepID=M0L7R6_NATLA|nr:nucleoside-triphosphatase [Halobiforma lacisalsi]APW97865.1 nucleotide kinase [Halobiforma lacisalsi AJ5]EMA29133.1 Nucleoside-triphosphatase [Halobiforma lacisalsi AJ5]